MDYNDLRKRLIVAPIETDISEEQVRREIEEACKYGVRGFIVDQYYVDVAKEMLEGKNFRLGMTVSYPLGAMTTEVKVELTKYAVSKGLDEINLSLNYNAIKSGDFKTAKEDLSRVVEVAGDKLTVIAIPMVAKVTLEELYKTCEMLLEVGVNRVKTNSGMNLGTTQLEHVQFIKRNFGEKIGIEISGGIRTPEFAASLVSAGADAIHSSTWRKIAGAK